MASRRSSASRYAPSSEQLAKERHALELRQAGIDYATIADQVGISDKGEAYRYVQKALKRTLEPAASSLRELEAARLDRLQAAVWTSAIRGDLKAVDRVLRISDQRARLLGLNAPLKTELTVAIDQQQAHMLLTAIRGILGDLQLTPDQQTLSGEVVSRHLRAIEGGTADTPGEATA